MARLRSPGLLGLLCVLAAGPAAAQGHPGPTAVIARVGDSFIGEQEFLERYELLPAFGRHRSGQREASKDELLASMIAERLMALAAASSGFDTRADFVGAVNEIRGMLARDALYKEEIIRTVKVPAAEISTGISRALRQRIVRFVWCDQKGDAEFLRSQITNAKALATLEIDSSLRAVRDTAIVHWGDGNPDIEDAAYALKKGSVSPVVETPEGYYILTLVSDRPDPRTGQMTADVLRERVTTAIRRTKERARLDAYVAGVLRGRNGRALDRPVRMLAAALKETYEPGTDTIVALTPARMEDLAGRCSAFMQDTIAVAGDRAFSVEDVLLRLRSTSFSIRRDALRYLPDRLNTELRTIVQQELLAQEGCRRGMDTLPDVQQRINVWRNAFLAGEYSDSVRRSAVPTEAEVWRFLRSRDSTVVVPSVRLRLLITSTAVEMQGALDLLGKGQSLAAVCREWSNQAELRQNEGDTGEFRVTERQPLGELAAPMKVGERYGPVRTADGYAYFEVLARGAAAHDEKDSVTAARFADAQDNLQRMMGRRRLTLTIAKLAKDYGVDIYTDRLRMLQVSPIPMMTFRILGFGGRMFPVPFVDPQIEWLEVGDPEKELP